jgi:hypothetical protein
MNSQEKMTEKNVQTQIFMSMIMTTKTFCTHQFQQININNQTNNNVHITYYYDEDDNMTVVTSLHIQATIAFAKFIM